MVDLVASVCIAVWFASAVIYEVFVCEWMAFSNSRNSKLSLAELDQLESRRSFVFLTKILGNKLSRLEKYRICKSFRNRKAAQILNYKHGILKLWCRAYSHLFKSGVVLTTFANFRSSRRLDLGKLLYTHSALFCSWSSAL